MPQRGRLGFVRDPLVGAMRKAIPVSEWVWFGHAGHFICGQWCRFHLCTKVGRYLVSTVGEYWPDRAVREIHAHVYDPKWLEGNVALLGDAFDDAYMKRFGFQPMGASEHRYETMVFKAGPKCTVKDCDCGMPIPGDWSDLSGSRWMTPGEASIGHYKFCQEYAKK